MSPPNPTAFVRKPYAERSFDLHGLDGISDAQIGEHLHHEGVPTGFRPLLVMDVWEHAFMRDYEATERAKYIEAFHRNIDWGMIERRLQESSALPLAPPPLP